MKAFPVVLFCFFATQAYAVTPYPTSPDPNLTPGALCASPTEYRYPERVPYCNRSVGGGLKKDVIEKYDEALGYSIGKMSRGQFKIDHYIPLCMGGSNSRDNLWPQHETVYSITDKLEAIECEKMAKGRLLQNKAIDIMRRAKANLKEAPELLAYVQAL